MIEGLAAWVHNPFASTLLSAGGSSATEDPLLFLLNFGTLGVWVFCNATGLQPTRGEVKRLDAEIARLTASIERMENKDRSKDQAVEALVNLMTSRTLPTLATAVTEIPQAAAHHAAQTEAALGQKLEDALRRVERVLGDDQRST